MTRPAGRGGYTNRAGRRSGGSRPAKMYLPRMSADDLRLMATIEKVRQEFGEAGVERFMQLLEEHARGREEDER
jgi:hypothetical protein